MNHAVFFSVTSLFLDYTQSTPSVYQDVLLRLRGPLLNLLGCGPEVVFDAVR